MPTHIDPGKLPDRVYWKAYGKGCWYTSWRDESGKQHSQRLAGPDATLADLHRAMEDHQGIQRGTLRHLVQSFEASPQFAKLAPATQRDYRFSAAGLIDTRMKTGRPLGEAKLSAWSRPVCQTLIDKIARERGPSAAAHALRYLKRLFRWGINRGHLTTNHAQGVEPPEERRQRKVPTPEVYVAAVAYAKRCGTMTERTKGSCAPYLWAVMELAYLLRLRGAEVLDMSDERATEAGVVVIRRKGSRGNVTAWSPRVRAAWDALTARRDAIWQKRKMPVPLHPKDRPLVVNASGDPLQRSSLSTAWDRLMRAAVEAGQIQSDQVFTLHGLKHLGITNTAGTWADKREAGGHKSDAMVSIYDHSVPTVEPTER
jgi:site-specific recombinase XerD